MSANEQKYIISRKRNRPHISKTAPAKEFSEEEETNDEYSSYEYYIYYHSIIPIDPRLPKPTYIPKANIEFLKSPIEEEKKEEDNESLMIIDLNSTNRIHLGGTIPNEDCIPKEINVLIKVPKINQNNNSSNSNEINEINENEEINENIQLNENDEVNENNEINEIKDDNENNDSMRAFPPHPPLLPMMFHLQQQQMLYHKFQHTIIPQGTPYFSNMPVLPTLAQKNSLLNLSLDENKIIEKAKTQNGSRKLQNLYKKGSNDEKEKIFKTIKPEIFELSKNPHGNYLIQEIIKENDIKKNNYIFELLKNDIYELALDESGCLVIEELVINKLDKKNVLIIKSVLENKLETCMEDKYANHLIQKLIENLKEEDFKEIFEKIYNTNILKYAQHIYGSRVIQSLLEKCNEE